MFEWSEVFMSIEGEAKYSGHPTAYIRFARCNFQCRKFNNPENLDTASIDVLGFNPKDYKDIYSIPLIHKGCDSIYSWDEKFSHMWNKGTAEDVGEEVLKVLPHNSFINPKTNKRVILSLTGGEPTLRMKNFVPLLSAPQFKEAKHILIETNCSVPLRQKDVEAFYSFCNDNNIWITWSNSPKLPSVSGEKWEQAINPKIAITQYLNDYGNSEQYFKFVCGPNEQDFNEVETAMNEYFNAGIPRDVEVYIMPVAATEEQQQEVSAKVAKMCMDRGYIYCHRIQNSVFGNGVGT